MGARGLQLGTQDLTPPALPSSCKPAKAGAPARPRSPCSVGLPRASTHSTPAAMAATCVASSAFVRSNTRVGRPARRSSVKVQAKAGNWCAGAMAGPRRPGLARAGREKPPTMHPRSPASPALPAGSRAARPPPTWRTCPPATASTLWASVSDAARGAHVPPSLASAVAMCIGLQGLIGCIAHSADVMPLPIPVPQPLSPPPWPASASLRCSTAAGPCWAPPASWAWRCWVSPLQLVGQQAWRCSLELQGVARAACVVS